MLDTGYPARQDNTILGKKPRVMMNQSMEKPRTGGSFIKNYKDITFDTLKERHDNFSIEKVLSTKNQIYNTLHFTGI